MPPSSQLILTVAVAEAAAAVHTQMEVEMGQMEAATELEDSPAHTQAEGTQHALHLPLYDTHEPIEYIRENLKSKANPL